MTKQDLFQAARQLMLQADPGQILVDAPDALDEYDFAIYEVMPFLLTPATTLARVQKTLGQALGGIYFKSISAPVGLYDRLAAGMLAERAIAPSR